MKGIFFAGDFSMRLYQLMKMTYLDSNFDRLLV